MADLKAKLRNTGTLMAKQTVAGGGKGGATDWAHLKDKPFETLGDDFTVDNGELQIAGNYATEQYVDDAIGTITDKQKYNAITSEGVYQPSYRCYIPNSPLIEKIKAYIAEHPVSDLNIILNYSYHPSPYNIVEDTQNFTAYGKIEKYGSIYWFKPRISAGGVVLEEVFDNIRFINTTTEGVEYGMTIDFHGQGEFRLNYLIVKDIPYDSELDDDVEVELVKSEVLPIQISDDSSSSRIGTIILGNQRYNFAVPGNYATEDYVDDAIADIPSVEIDNKSLVKNDQGQVQEAVPVYTENIDEVRQVTRAGTMYRGIIWTNKFYANPYTDYTNPVDITIRYWYTGLNGNEGGETITGQWNAVDLTDTSAIYTDESGKRWTIYTEVEESDHPILNYIAFNCLDELENGYYHFDYEIPAMSIYGYDANREQQGYENKWTTNGYAEVLNNIVDYPNVDEIYFKYLIQQGYSTYEQVDVVTSNVDISQPIIITDTKNVEWKITCTRNTDNLNAVLITLEALSDLPVDFRDLEYMDIDDSYGNIFLKFQARVIDTVIHQVPAEYVPIDNYTIQNVDGKLVAVQQVGSVSNVEYEDFTGGQGQQIGALRVTNEQGVGETYIYAPSSSEWSTIGNKPFETVGEGLEVVNGAIKEKVPVYTETIDEMPAGLQITGWQDTDGIGDDADGSININGSDITLNIDTDAYTVTAKINNHIYSGSWTAATDQGHSYGGYTWIIPELDVNPTCEFYLENTGSGDYNTHIYLNNQVNCSNVEWLIITPNNAGDVIENYRDAGIFNHNVSWSYGQQGGETVHQLPAQYVPIDNDTIINDNGVLKAAGGGGSVDIDNKSIIKNQDDELQTAIPVYSEQVSSTHNSIQNWNVKSGYYHYARQNAYAGYLRGALRNTGDAFYTVIVNFDYNNQTYQASGVCNNIGLGSSNNFVSGDILDYFTGFGVATSNSGQGQLYCPDWNKSAGIRVNWAVVKEAEYNATYESTDLEVVETVYHQIPYEYIPAEQSILSKNSNGRLSLAKNIINDMVRFGNGFMRGGYIDNKYPEFMGINVSFSSNNNSIISNNTSGARTAIGGAFGAANGPGNTSQGSIDFTRRSDKYILESKNNTIFNSIGDNSYAWIGFYYNYVGTNNPEHPSGCPFYIVGRIRLGDITNDKADFDIEGCEAILDSAVYDSSISKYVFTFKQDIYPSIRMEYFYLTIAQYKPINDKYQKVNSFFLPLDNSTIIRDTTNGNIKTAIPAPPTTDGTYTLQVVVSNGTPTYSWI